MTIGDRIRKRREELNLSQDELARLMGYKSRSTINKIELGINDISISNIFKFAEVLETTIIYLLGEESVYGDKSDIEFVEQILPHLKQKQELPPVLNAANIILNESGIDIIKVDGRYSLINNEGGTQLTENEINQFLNTVVLSVKNIADTLSQSKMKELRNFFENKP